MTMKKIEIDTFLKFRFLSNPHFSPDGTKIAFTVSVPDRETNGYLSDLYLYDLGKKTVSRVTCSGDAKTWSWTAENTLIFTAARTAALKKEKENGTSFLYEISPSGGEAQCITSIPATVTGIRLLPDGRYLLTIRHDNYRDTRKKSYEVFDELPFWAMVRDTRTRRGTVTPSMIWDPVNSLTWRTTGPTVPSILSLEISCSTKHIRGNRVSWGFVRAFIFITSPPERQKP